MSGTEERNFVGLGALRAFLGCLISSAGYHLGAFSEAWGTTRLSPFFGPPTCFVARSADIVR
jgi:hypothetical protein